MKHRKITSALLSAASAAAAFAGSLVTGIILAEGHYIYGLCMISLMLVLAGILAMLLDAR